MKNMYERPESALCQLRGLLLEDFFHFNYAIKCSVHTGDSVIVHYSLGSTHIVIRTFIKDFSTKRYNLDCAVSKLIYTRNWKLFIAYRVDLHLMVYNQNFVSLQTIPLTSSILSFAYNDLTNELYTGAVGCIQCWNLSYQLKEPLSLSGTMECSISKKEWIISLQLSVHCCILVAGCQNGVYILDWKTRKQVNYQPNIHTASITCATVYTPGQYLITAAKDGSIKVLSSILNRELCTSMHPMGHVHEVTGLCVHPNLPFLISSSLDGNVRVWDLQSFEQYCSYHCTSPILECSLMFNRDILCCSQSEITVLRLNRVERSLCSLHSNIDCISTVSERNQSALVTVEDGSARLLSTVTGQTITIMFPLYTVLPIKEVVCSVYDRLLYVLLSSGEVMVYTGATNPSCAVQLWFPEDDDDCVTCITMTQNRRHSLLIAGHQSGCLSILCNGGCRIPPQPYFAHGRSIVKLVSSQDFVDFRKKFAATIVSYGEDDSLHVWMLFIEKELKSECSLKRMMSVTLAFEPTCIATSNSYLAITTPDSRVLCYRLPLQERCSISHHYDCATPSTNQPEDTHTKTITSISIHQTLNLIATSGEDGKIKVWDSSCDLVAEVVMGSAVDAICFVTKGADILIGFHQQLCVIPGMKLLPPRYLEGLHKVPDMPERLLPFDPQLEFWYDDERVPMFPLWDHHRFDSLPLGSLRVNKSPSTHVLIKGKMIDDKISSSMLPLVQQGRRCEEEREGEKQIDRSSRKHQFKRRNARKHTQVSLECGDQDKINIIGSSDSISSNVASEVSLPIVALFSKVSVKPLTNQSPEHFIAPDGFVPNSVVRHQFKPLVSLIPESTSKAYYTLEESILKKIIRRSRSKRIDEELPEIEYPPPPLVQQPSIYRPRWNFNDFDSVHFDTNDKPVNRYTRNTTTETDQTYSRYKNSIDKLSGMARPNLDDLSLHRNRIAKMKGRGGNSRPSESSNQNTASTALTESLVNEPIRELPEERELSPQQSADYQESSVKTTGNNDREPPLIPVPSAPVASGVVSDPTNQRAVKSATVRSLRDKSPVTLLSRRRARGAQASRPQSASPTSMLAQISRSRETETRSPEMGDVERGSTSTLQDHSAILSERKRIPIYNSVSPEATDVDSISPWLLGTDKLTEELQSESNVVSNSNLTSMDTTRSDSSMNSLENLNKKKIAQRLEEIVLSPWFPVSNMDFDEDALTVESVTTQLLKIMKSVNSVSFGQVCNAITDLNDLGCFSSSQKMEIVSVILEKMQSESSSVAVKANCLNMIAKLNVKTPAVLKTILPFLTNTNEKLQTAAFSALKDLTGVSTRAELHQLLVDIGLIQQIQLDEDQVLKDLEGRLRDRLRTKSLSNVATTHTSFSGVSSLNTSTDAAAFGCSPDQLSIHKNLLGVTSAMSTPYQGLTTFPFNINRPQFSGPLPSPLNNAMAANNIVRRDLAYFSQSATAQEKMLDCYSKTKRVSSEGMKNKGAAMNELHRMTNKAGANELHMHGTQSKGMNEPAGVHNMLGGIMNGLVLGGHNRGGEMNELTGGGVHSGRRGTKNELGVRNEGANNEFGMQTGSQTGSGVQNELGVVNNELGIKNKSGIPKNGRKHSGVTNELGAAVTDAQQSSLHAAAADGTDWDKYEWNNVQVMMHMKHSDLFSQIIWQKKDTVDAQMPKVN